MDRKIIRNFLYNVAYQILILLLPFVTIPYISRIFTPETIGIYSSTYANSQIFCILALFATASYGSKEIAIYRENKKMMSKTFYEIRMLQSIATIVAIFLYIISCVFIYKNSNSFFISLLQGINIIAVFFDISWLFIGIEDFKKTVLRNTAVKVVSLLLIFIFVNEKDDLVIYTLIISLSNIVGNISMWVYKKKIVYKRKKVRISRIKRHAIDASILLIQQIFFQIYTGYDKSILSIVSSSSQVGLYDQSQKLIRISISVVTSLSLVMLPRMSNIINNDENKIKINKLLKESMTITTFLSIACSFGLFAISDNFVPWFFGDEYLEVSVLLKMTAIVGILTAIGGVLSNQYAIPVGKKSACVIPIFIAALVSIVLNIVLGKKLGAIGACITIVVAESISLILKLFYLRKDLNYLMLFKGGISFISSGILMIISIKIIDYLLKLNPGIISTLVEIIVGGLVYIFCGIFFNNELRVKIIKKMNKSLNKKSL